MKRLALPLLVLAALVFCRTAFGDADPASDVLLGENVFYPYNPQVSRNLQATLDGEVAAAHKAHLPIKVALIATPVDLGAIPTFFGKPKQYAAFLDQEISFAAGKVPLLVVMPNGYGSAGLPSAATSSLAALQKPTGSGADGLAQAASRAVPKLAAAAGHPLAGAGAGTSGGSGGGVGLPLAILAAVCIGLTAVIIAVRRRAGRSR